MVKVFYHFHAGAWDGKVDTVKEMLKDRVPLMGKAILLSIRQHRVTELTS